MTAFVTCISINVFFMQMNNLSREIIAEIFAMQSFYKIITACLIINYVHFRFKSFILYPFSTIHHSRALKKIKINLKNFEASLYIPEKYL